VAGPAIKLHARSHTHGVAGDGTALAPVSLDVTAGPVRFSGDISPAQLTANQNDYNPTGLSTAAVLRLSTDASRTITGLAGGADGRLLLVMNVGAQDLVLADESASSTAANRFALDGDLTLGADTGATLYYDGTSSRWRLLSVGKAVAAGGGAHTHTGDALVPESVEITGGPLAYRGDVTPAQLTADQNDYNPTGLADAVVLRLDTNAQRTITGLAGGADGRVLVLVNVGAQNLILADESASSTAANRFALDAALTVWPDTAVHLLYDATVSRWRVTGVGGAARIRLADGDSSTPALSFAAETGLGFYRASGNRLCVAGNGADLFHFFAQAPYFLIKSNTAQLAMGVAVDLTWTRTAAGSYAVGGLGNGQLLGSKVLTELTTIAAAATTDTTIQIPQHAKVVAVSVRVTVAIPTATTFDVGVAGATTRYGAGLSTAADTTNPGTNDDGMRYYGTATAIRITPNLTPATNAGRVRVTIHYVDVTPPTS
jgi:hypothetical protein